jgi:uncharacterized protein (TIGR02246 family)
MPATTPEACDALFGQYVNAGDLDALIALYEPDAVLAAMPGEPAAVGHAAIREALGAFVGMKAHIVMRVVQTHRTGDVAVLYNDWHGTITGPDGQPVRMEGKAIEVVRRQPDGTWRFVVDDPYARG